MPKGCQPSLSYRYTGGQLMNHKTRRFYVATFISLVGLLAVIALAEDNPFSETASRPGAGSEKSLLATAPKAPVASESIQRCHCTDDANPTIEKIIRALHGPLSGPGLDYTDTPLHEVLLDLQQRSGIPIHIDRAALDEFGVNIDESVTVNFRNISLGAAMRLMLKELQLTYIIENEVLFVTTHDRAEKSLMTCVYDVRDLGFTTTSAAAKSTSPSADNNRLAEVIIDCIATDTWAKNGGGQAEVQPLGPDLLVISQTRSVHEEIQQLLNTIRKVKSEQ